MRISALLSVLLPVLFALFLWWFTTGLIIVVYGRSQRTRRLCYAAATAALLLAVAGLWFSRHGTDPRSVYLAVTCGVVIWGWQIASYYLGFVTGPSHLPRIVGQESRTFWRRFQLAFQAGIHHEAVVAATALLLVVLTGTAENRWGLWMFVTLWVMHSIAKLNVFLGVRNFHIEFLPPHLHFLRPLLQRRISNPFFPVSMVVATTVALIILSRAFAPATTPTQATGLLMVGTMICLGILEQLLLVLPLPATLWGWGLRPLPKRAESDTNTVQRQKGASLQTLPEQS
jgi:putative photosynthetic complex assembly protein 2